MSEEYKPHVSERKKEHRETLEKWLKECPIIGVIDVSGLPCAQLQSIKKKLSDKITIFMTKKRIAKIAIDKAKKDVPGLEKLKDHLQGIPALMFTKENPFKIFNIIKKNKTPAAAKAGQTAPKDLVIPAGPTEFGPGPIVGELGAFGIKAGIENGKVAIKSDFTVAKKGDTIDDRKAGLLAKFNIKPMEIGLNVTSILENGEILPAEVLDIDEKEYLKNIMTAASWAFNLSVEAVFVTKENADLLISKAFNDAKALAIEQGILEEEVVEQILSKASVQAASLKQQLNI